MKMIQYKPWEKKQTENLISQSGDSLPILDVQLGGACNLKCIYCDTPKYGLPCSVDLPSIEKLMNDGNLNGYMFVA